ncbi:MAG: hypothetical protein L3J45_10975 [Flavobacteriaceae bacterium]|nr:hypothetical protein [Flavobacteriaceae bacterium]
MYNNKQLIKRAGFMLALTLLLLGNKGMAQSKYNLQITKGYAVSEDWDVNGSNLDLSVSRKIWSVISVGLYYDLTNVDNLKTKYNSNGARQNANGFFIPPALDQYIKSSDFPGFFSGWEQNISNFKSFGFKTNFDFKVSSKFKAGFYVGLGLTQRKIVSMFLSDAVIDDTTGLIIDYTPASLFLKTTEFSSRYGLKFSYVLSPKFNLILQAGHNTSSFKKYSYGKTAYTIMNLGVAFKL